MKIRTKIFATVTLLTIFYSCKSQYAYEHPVKLIYMAPYNKQVIFTKSILDDPKSAEALGKTLLSVFYIEQKIDFNENQSIKATLVNKNDIWKVKVIREENIDDVKQPAHYYCYIRKSDGALLYATKEVGEWIGTTDLEERQQKDNINEKN